MEETNFYLNDLPDVQVETLKQEAKELVEYKKANYGKKNAKAKQEESEPKKDVFTGLKSPEELRKMSFDARKRYYAWCRDRDREMVTGVFRNFEMPGEILEFPIRIWEEPLEVYRLKDGETYTIPRGVVRHLNTNCWYPIYEYMPGGKTIHVPGGRPTNMRVGKKVRRFGFQPIEISEELSYDAPELTNPVVYVEHVSMKNIPAL